MRISYGWVAVLGQWWMSIQDMGQFILPVKEFINCETKQRNHTLSCGILYFYTPNFNII